MNLRTRWYKVISDLWNNRSRTLIVALAVAVGIYAVSAVSATQTVLRREYDNNLSKAITASATLVTDPFLDDLADRVSEIPGVAAAEGRQTISVRASADPNGPESWHDINLIVVSDFNNMHVDSYPFVDGIWPDAKDELMLEWQGRISSAQASATPSPLS
ncbi:MAG: hypothetical protein R3C44_15505 [Chloroflexota bacterium]